jgi:hypothetical protein
VSIPRFTGENALKIQRFDDPSGALGAILDLAAVDVRQDHGLTRGLRDGSVLRLFEGRNDLAGLTFFVEDRAECLGLGLE